MENYLENKKDLKKEKLRIQKSKDETLGYTDINDKLYKEILSGIPKEYDAIKKAIYIYIKMCQIFTYDGAYAMEPEGLNSNINRNIDNLVFKSSKNNKVTCFELSAIFKYFLAKLNIRYNEIEGWGHTYTVFNIGNYVVKADFVSSVFNSDLTKAKTNQELTGIECINKVNGQDIRLKNIVKDVNNDINKKEKKYIFENIQSIKNMSIHQRLYSIINIINSRKLEGIDALTYLNTLSKKCFYDEIKEGKYSYCIIKDYNISEFPLPSGIITFKLDNDEYEYYYFIPDEGLNKINKEELQEAFDEGDLDYIYGNHKIPGIYENHYSESESYGI